MIKRRLIPKLQIKSKLVNQTKRMILVTTIRFNEVISIGDPVSQAKIYESQFADELILMDLDASTENRETAIEVIRKVAEQIFMPITVGGGVKSVADFRNLLANGADKVSINTAALDNPLLITEAADMYGSQCVVLSIDYRQGEDGLYSVYSTGGKKNKNIDPVEWAVQGEKLGAGEILLTSIDKDGTGEGLDIELTRKVTDSVSIPVITSGGCGIAKHFISGFIEGKADAVSAGTYFCFKDENPMQTRSQIKNAGIPIRLQT